MSEFIVSEVIDGHTFKVKNGWKWNDKRGDTIWDSGYNTPEKEEERYEGEKQKLVNLILGKKVDIKNSQTIDEWGRLVADVCYKDKNLAEYFPEYKI